MKVALCQINTILGNFDHNREKIIKYYNNSIELNSDIVVFPELSITGYPPQDLLLDVEFLNENLNTLHSISRISTVPLIIGYVRKEGKNIYNFGIDRFSYAKIKVAHGRFTKIRK